MKDTLAKIREGIEEQARQLETLAHMGTDDKALFLCAKANLEHANWCLSLVNVEKPEEVAD